jgi:aryl-alcohol dehydrogenase-like predicted oxidoreductase
VTNAEDRFRIEVLSSIADDYEPLTQILDHFQRFAPEMEASGHKVKEALGDLVQQGLARAYVLSSHPPQVTEVDFDPSNIENLYFYATAAGKRVVESDSKLET